MKTIDKCIYDEYVEAHMEELWNLSLYVHDHPELGYQEHKACAIQCEYLVEAGFDVTSGIEEMDTAYVARYGHGKPVIAVLSEYDALKGLGHGCGHNLICASALATGITIQKYLQDTKREGTLLVVGTPAEEGGGGKIKLLEKGIFDEVDAVFMMHPTSDKTRLAGACMSSMRMGVTFQGTSAHAGSHPENGVNALSAANLFLNAIGLWRQHFKSDMRVSMIITEGGEQPGMIPDHISLAGNLSCFKMKDLHWLKDTMEACVDHCAKAMGCVASIDIQEGYQGRVPNEVLSNVCRAELEAIEEPLLDGIPADFGGEDLGNISRRIPICNPYVTIFPDYKISGHTEQFKELSRSAAGRRCIEVTGKAMSRSIMDVYEDPDILCKAKEELTQRLASGDV